MDFAFFLYSFCMLATECFIPPLITGVIGIISFTINKFGNRQWPKRKIFILMILAYIIIQMITCFLVGYLSRNVYAM